jgi:predicted transcriptional regulator
MAERLTIELPDDLMEQIRTIATRTQRSSEHDKSLARRLANCHNHTRKTPLQWNQ